MKNKLLKRTLLWSVLFMASLIGFFSCSGCSKQQTNVYMVPDDAAFVMHINLGNIWNKGDFDHINQISYVKYLLQELRDDNPRDAEVVNDLLNDPNTYGFNLKGEFFAFMSKTTGDEVCVGYTINDAGKYKNFLKDLCRNTDVVFSSENGYSLAYTKEHRTAFCWDDNKAYLYSSSSERDANSYAQKLMSLQEDNSLAQNADFNTFLQANNDLGLFVNTDLALELAGPGELEQYEEYLDQLQHTSLCLSLNFENGGIRLPFAILGLENNPGDRFVTDDFNGDLLNYLPQQTLAALSFSFNINSLLRMLEGYEDVDLDESVTDGLSVRELIQSFTGNFAASLSDIRFDGYNGEDLDITITAVAELNNGSLLKEKMVQSDKARRDGDSYLFEDETINVGLNGNVIMVTTKPSLLNMLSGGRSGNGVEKIAQKAKKGNYLYLDLDIHNYPSSLTQELGSDIVNLAGGFLKDAEFNVTGQGRAEIFIGLQNSDKNSLDFILHYIDDNLTRIQRLL